MDPFHVLYTKRTLKQVHRNGRTLLDNTFVWYDFWSQPQPSHEKDKSCIEKVRADLKAALDSVGAYVERADTLVILAPPSIHSDLINKETGRKMYTCYRTWRRRGFCVLELFASFFSRRSTHPVLLIQSATDVPMWISSQESLKLAVGECDFTCCEMNHLAHDGKTQ